MRGLSVVGVTSEPKEPTDNWMTELGGEYAYAYDTSKTLMGKLGCKGYPSAVLVNPKGTVVWKGHPGGVNGSLIQDHLAGASRTPVAVAALTKKWPDSANDVKKAFAKGGLGKAMAAADRLAKSDQETGASVKEDIQRLIDRHFGKLKATLEEGDYYGATVLGKGLSKRFKGLPEAKEVSTLVKGIKKDPAARRVLKAQGMIAKISAMAKKAKKKKDVEPLIKKLESIASKNEGTFAAASAVKLSESLRKSMERMRR